LTPKIALIGGSGIYELKNLQQAREEKLNTPFGEIIFYSGKWGGKDIIFLPRHGKDHKIPPNKINYRGNIYALKFIGIERILSTSATGSLNPQIKVGSFVIIDQFIDFTKDRPPALFTEGDVIHIDMSEPYCPELRNILISVSDELRFSFYPKGTYICTEGPRFETPAEIKAFKVMGADLVGMTNVPEVVFAREAGICYASVAIVTNMAAGIKGGNLTSTEVSQKMKEAAQEITELFLNAIKEIPNKRGCVCGSVLKDSKMKPL